MGKGDLAYGTMIGLIGVLLFVVGASVITTIWWVGVCFIVSGLAVGGFGLFTIAVSNEQMPSLRGF